MNAEEDTGYIRELRELLFDQQRSFERAWEAASRGTVKLRGRVCPVCGSLPSPETSEREYRWFIRCLGCGLVYMTPILDGLTHMGFEDTDPIMRRYWELRSSRAPHAPMRPDPHQDPQLRDLVRHKAGGRLLDVGCGLGDFLRKAAYFFHAEGVEINPRLREAASEAGSSVFERLEELPDQPVYDAITFHQLLYGLPDPLRVMGEAAKRLKKGGVLYVNTPNSDSWAVRVFGDRHCHFLCTNLNVFNLSSLRHLAGRVGLRIIDWRTEWLDLYPGDLLVRWLFPGRFLHRRNSFMPFYRPINSWMDHFERRWLDSRLGRRGDYLIAMLGQP